MFCIVSFVVLSILGIFSASNRQLAREALDCVFRRVTLRPCNTGFDEKIKARILGVVITRSEGAARFLNHYFEVISWVFFVLLLASSIMSVRGLYLYYTTGSCNGLNSSAFCVFDPNNRNNEVSAASQACTPDQPKPSMKDLTLKGVDLSLFPVKNAGLKDTIVFVGCYECDYTRKAYPMIKELISKSKVTYYHLEYPNKEKEPYTLSKAAYCAYNQDADKYWKLNDIFFTADKKVVETQEFIDKSFADVGLDVAKADACMQDPKTEETVKKMQDEVVKTKFYGTPTIFINGQPFVGPKPYRVYAIALRGLWYW